MSRKQTGKDPSWSPTRMLQLTFENATANEKALMINTYNYVKKTWPAAHQAFLIEKTSTMCGISFETIDKVLTEHKKKQEVETVKVKRVDILKQLDDDDKGAIRQKIHNFYFKGELPFVEKVLQALNDDNNLPNFSMKTLKRTLKHLKFTCIIKKSLVTDRLKIGLWRIHYLRDIEKFRMENRRIFYLDETWVNAGHTEDNTSVDQSIISGSQTLAEGHTIRAKTSTTKGKRLIISLIGKEDGFVEEGEWIFESTSNGDNQEIMDASDFEKWFEKILSILQPNDVLVMDSASYHSRLTEETPTMFSRKKYVQDWLTARSIPFDETDIQAILIEKVKSVKADLEFYATDEMAKAKGVIVLRIPPYHSGLNPFELVWPEMKDYVARHNTTLKSDVKKLVKEGLAQITSDKWKQCVESVIKEEEKMRGLDHLIDDLVDSYLELHKPSSDDDETSDSSESVFFSSNSSESEVDSSESEVDSSESEFDSSESEFDSSESDFERMSLRS